ncbi:YetF domain-containing protein [Ureibacillus endophyticus]
MNNSKFLQITDGRPSIVIKEGKVLEESMRKNQLAIDELMMLLREKGVI